MEMIRDALDQLRQAARLDPRQRPFVDRLLRVAGESLSDDDENDNMAGETPGRPGQGMAENRLSTARPQGGY